MVTFLGRSLRVGGCLGASLLFGLWLSGHSLAAEHGKKTVREANASQARVNQVGIEQKFEAFLAAGEFGPAKQLASQAAASSDGMLRKLAAAQARAGARGASWSTAAEISNDAQRSAAYDELAKHPLSIGGARGAGARGGAALADFDSLIELMKSTVVPDSWDDAGGPGAVESFPGGVLVDAAGTMKRISFAEREPVLASLRRAALSTSGNGDVRAKSALRKVSLTRLERQSQWLAAQGKRPDAAMRVLAGMTKVQYLFVYPETRDIVVAGPAGDWTVDPEGRIVNVETRRPALRLDDLVVLLRNALTEGGRFRCSITPRQTNLAEIQAFLAESSQQPLRPGGREKWLDQLRSRLGDQDITVEGLDPRTRTARILVEADYRMKLVGIGLEPGVVGVRSYLDSIDVAPGESPPPTEVLRWWFTLNSEALKTTEDRNAFEFVGSVVKLKSENELLTERGERVHTGDAKNLNRLFAQSFNRHFEQLSVKYPIYAELRNVFDLSLVAALIRSEELTSRCDWTPLHFGRQGNFPIEFGFAPHQVASVINHRELDRKHFVVGVSGGVSVDTASAVRPEQLQVDRYGQLSAERGAGRPPELPKMAWWWD